MRVVQRNFFACREAGGDGDLSVVHGAGADFAFGELSALAGEDEGLAIFLDDGGAGDEEGFFLGGTDEDLGGGGKIGDQLGVIAVDGDTDGDGTDEVLLAATGDGEGADGVEVALEREAGEGIDGDAGGFADAELADFGLVDGAFDLHGFGVDNLDGDLAGGDDVTDLDGVVFAAAEDGLDDGEAIHGSGDGEFLEVDLVTVPVAGVTLHGVGEDLHLGGMGGFFELDVLEKFVVAGFGFVDGELEEFLIEGGAEFAGLQVETDFIEFGFGDTEILHEVLHVEGLFGLALDDIALGLHDSGVDVINVILEGLAIDFENDLTFLDHAAADSHLEDGHGAVALGAGEFGDGDVGEVAGGGDAGDANGEVKGGEAGGGGTDGGDGSEAGFLLLGVVVAPGGRDACDEEDGQGSPNEPITPGGSTIGGGNESRARGGLLRGGTGIENGGHVGLGRNFG